MHRSGAAILAISLAALHTQTFSVSRAAAADVEQQALRASDGEVFPGSYVSPYGEAIVKRISELIGRVDELDRATLVEAKVGVGFDRSIAAWRANASGTTVALAVRYHRDRFLQMGMKFANDYGGAEPLDPGDFESLTVARCTRAPAGWTCGEELLAAVAKAQNVALPAGAAERAPVVEKLLERALSEK
jgi:hypothetical protein